jgi:membrane protein YdbS with pleckstrin-like domain
MYKLFKGLLLALLKAPATPPPPPAGSPDSIRTFRAAPNFLKYKVIVLWAGLFIPLLGGFGAAIGLQFDDSVDPLAKILVWIAPAFFLFTGTLSYFMIRLEYDMRYYIVTDRSLRIREGIWSIREITITFANIQHLEIHQGPIMQLLGISDLMVHTAGGGATVGAKQGAVALGHHGVFRGIENAEQVRDQINALLKRYRDSGLGDPEGPRPKTLATASAGLSSEAVQRLREIRDEIRALTATRKSL